MQWSVRRRRRHHRSVRCVATDSHSVSPRKITCTDLHTKGQSAKSLIRNLSPGHSWIGGGGWRYGGLGGVGDRDLNKYILFVVYKCETTAITRATCHYISQIMIMAAIHRQGRPSVEGNNGKSENQKRKLLSISDTYNEITTFICAMPFMPHLSLCGFGSGSCEWGGKDDGGRGDENHQTHVHSKQQATLLPQYNSRYVDGGWCRFWLPKLTFIVIWIILFRTNFNVSMFPHM